LFKTSKAVVHGFLGVETPYHIWFPRMVEYGFEETTILELRTKKSATAQGNETSYTDHAITIDMATCLIDNRIRLGEGVTGLG